MFKLDWVATGVVCFLFFFFLLFRKKFVSPSPFPSLGFSTLSHFPLSSRRTTLFSSLPFLYWMGFFSFLIAFIDPHFLLPLPSSSLSKQQPTEGLAIYFVLDQSGSMAEPISVIDEGGSMESLSKFDWLKKVTKQFIHDHPSDLIGLVSFARTPQVIVPLTLDRETLLSYLNHLTIVDKPEKEGSAIGYAIFKTAHLMAAIRYFSEKAKSEKRSPYTIQSSVVILVTDGFQNPSRLDQGNRLRTLELEEAAQVAKEKDVRLYIINVDPSFGSPAYLPHRRQMEQIAQLTGGEFYLVDSNQDLTAIYSKIERLEKGKIFHTKTIERDQRFSLYPFFILFGLGCLAAALIGDLWILKVVP